MKIADTILSRPIAYRMLQRPFADAKLGPFLRRATITDGTRILDVGCGPGTNTQHFPPDRYLGIDIDARYIASARERHNARFEVVDVVNDPIPGSEEFDLVIVNSLFHHIDTPGVVHTLQKLSERMAAGSTIHILDLMWPESAGPARLLARWDRGDFPRPLDEWRTLFEGAFDPVLFEPYPLPSRGPTLWHMVYFEGHRRT